MANTIRIKRSTGSSAPGTLKQAELAYAETHSYSGSQATTGTLFIGVGVSGENASSILAIAGPGSFLALSGTQTASGTYTFSGTVTFSGTTSLGAATATTPANDDDSTRVATTAWVLDRISAFGAGTVTSVGMSLPNIFTVAGSPVTSSGTLSATLANQSANQVFAGPTTGSSAAPAFRSLVAADIPDLSATYLTSAVTSVALSLPNIFTVSGSPVTTTGTLSATLASQTQNHVFAAPGSGGNGSPAFRALVAGDIPDLSSVYLPLSGGTISSDLTVTGNLTVNGTTSNINSVNLVVEDKNVVLGDTASPSDATADGGGITLKGTTDKELKWLDATDSWTSSEHIELASTKSYRIAGASVLSGDTLGSGVTKSSLTQVGTITSGTWSATIDGATIDGGTF